ncbi:hypothetical protein ACVIGB_003899 [Bradyrhizobium sp. USDA 4341]|uniref:Uncharacterized protein n=1 Tax=Bradyrhizobium erythrophlei TaxID=1437360 RepID=A0A1H4X6C3_9BRAD|nr:hypothetical protein [Bradyrhizobium erythrophlei]SED00274.1 hypothetical protein SAMN05444164_3368 [Bradyrhizobium erythrophlei]
MALGKGKYDELCREIREKVGLGGGEIPQSGGVLLIVMGGEHGNGFSCQADMDTTLALPDLLERVARQIRETGPFIPNRSSKPR